MKMNKSKQQSVVSKIVGILVESGSNASDALKITEQAKETYLDRCWHITSNKNTTPAATEVEKTLNQQRIENDLDPIPEGNKVFKKV